MNRIICGDAYGEIRKLASESIDCIVTSPPYWGLRDYGVDGQLGLEHSFEEYLAKLCAVFDECKRVLKKTGTCWINLGDTYWNCSFIRGRSADGWMEKGDGERYDRYFAVNGGGVAGGRRRSGAHPTLKEKSLCLIPSRFAIAMVARGWILRNEIIWHKPNCMPASVKDRFTVDFEKLFFFTKSRTYYFSQQREPLAESSIQRLSQDISHQVGSSRANGGAKTNGNMKAAGDIVLGRNKRCVWVIPTQSSRDAHFAVYPERLIEVPIRAGCPPDGVVLDPFLGSGTTAVVAKKLGRKWIGIELSPRYGAIARRRVRATSPVVEVGALRNGES